MQLYFLRVRLFSPQFRNLPYFVSVSFNDDGQFIYVLIYFISGCLFGYCRYSDFHLSWHFDCWGVSCCCGFSAHTWTLIKFPKEAPYNGGRKIEKTIIILLWNGPSPEDKVVFLKLHIDKYYIIKCEVSRKINSLIQWRRLW